MNETATETRGSWDSFRPHWGRGQSWKRNKGSKHRGTARETLEAAAGSSPRPTGEKALQARPGLGGPGLQPMS
jgi:hypothetical protein